MPEGISLNQEFQKSPNWGSGAGILDQVSRFHCQTGISLNEDSGLGGINYTGGAQIGGVMSFQGHEDIIEPISESGAQC